ncbi:MAG: DUF2314 domain-containing protein [Polyangiaceae bacterium]|nr:DUF2314 domain-containing protein [Polyangiaceae bacterium]
MRGWKTTGLVLALCAISVGCKRSSESKPVPATVVHAVDAGLVAKGDAVPGGDLRRDFHFTVGVYHFAAPGKDAEVAARKLLAAAEVPVRMEAAGVRDAGAPLDKLSVKWARPPVSAVAPPSLDTLRFRGKTLSDAEKESLQKAPAVTVLTFSGPARDALRGYRLARAVVAALEKAAPGAILDAETRETLPRSEWGARAVHEGAWLPVHEHIVIDVYQDGELLRLVTLGMAKFGLPDVSVNQVSRHDSAAMGTLVNLVCQTLLERGSLPRPGELDVSVAGLTNEAARAKLEKDLVEVPGTGTLRLNTAEPHEGDAQNRLMEIAFPGRADELQQRQSKVLGDILGAKDSIVGAKHDEKLLAASARARAELLALKPRFAKKMPDLERLMVKGPFVTSSGGNEWMWIEVVRWNGTKLEGILQNDPFEVPGLKKGARVSVEESSIFDYIYSHADGGVEGNETSKLLEAAQPR